MKYASQRCVLAALFENSGFDKCLRTILACFSWLLMWQSLACKPTSSFLNLSEGMSTKKGFWYPFFLHSFRKFNLPPKKRKPRTPKYITC